MSMGCVNTNFYFHMAKAVHIERTIKPNLKKENIEEEYRRHGKI